MDVRRLDEMQAQGRSIFDTELAVAYYARVSTDKDEQINSLGNQKRYFEDYIAANPHWRFAGGYVDEGISGTSVEGREQFLKMIEDAKRGRFDLIVTKEISRFARNTLDSLRYTRELLRCGVGVYFQNDNINTFDKDAELRPASSYSGKAVPPACRSSLSRACRIQCTARGCGRCLRPPAGG